MKANRPAPALLIFLLFPVIGLVAAGIVILTNRLPATGGTPPTPAPVTLPPAQAVANSPMIDFTLTSLDGETVSLSDYAGRIVFLNFWATWCIPCQKELPAFEQFQAQQGADGAVILAVNVQETPEQITAFLDQYQVSGLNILLDSEGDASEHYGIFNMPTTFVIDGQGIVRYPKYGEVTLDELNGYVAALNDEA
ncbi:MAG: TlpA disulfide reductase family protein [Chloroflexota bacterium]